MILAAVNAIFAIVLTEEVVESVTSRRLSFVFIPIQNSTHADSVAFTEPSKTYIIRVRVCCFFVVVTETMIYFVY